jgi:hypothetical protein
MQTFRRGMLLPTSVPACLFLRIEAAHGVTRQQQATLTVPVVRISSLIKKAIIINPLKTKRRFYIRTQCVPRCEHSPLRL